MLRTGARRDRRVGVAMTVKGLSRSSRCGDKRCGRLVWLKTPLDEAGRPLRRRATIQTPPPVRGRYAASTSSKTSLFKVMEVGTAAAYMTLKRARFTA